MPADESTYDSHVSRDVGILIAMEVIYWGKLEVRCSYEFAGRGICCEQTLFIKCGSVDYRM